MAAAVHDQVLKDLPKKLERIEYCDMSNLQKTVYRETMVRSKKALMDPTKTGGPLTSPETRAKKNAASKTGRTSTESSSANVLMDLRKAANHPMLFRRLYDDKKLRNMAKDCLKELEFMDRDSGLIYEDMEVMTDFELHRFCQQYPVGPFFMLLPCALAYTFPTGLEEVRLEERRMDASRKDSDPQEVDTGTQRTRGPNPRLFSVHPSPRYPRICT